MKYINQTRWVPRSAAWNSSNFPCLEWDWWLPPCPSPSFCRCRHDKVPSGPEVETRIARHLDLHIEMTALLWHCCRNRRILRNRQTRPRAGHSTPKFGQAQEVVYTVENIVFLRELKNLMCLDELLVFGYGRYWKVMMSWQVAACKAVRNIRMAFFYKERN